MTYSFESARLKVALTFVVCAIFSCAAAFGQCSSPANAIVAENCLTGSPSSAWDLDPNSAGDTTIQGFATDISYNVGQTVSFKINTPASGYTITIYRVGYYGGLGARQIATVAPSAKLPQTQPACLTDASTSLYDCGNWAVSATWTIPSNATSGVYFAHLVRSDTGGDSHIVFVVRNDASTSAVLFQTSDETWQAYNPYGGNSLYGGPDTFNLPGRAYKVSYNRPFLTRGFVGESATWLFGAEYPLIRWLESNGYDVSYSTGLDAARNGSLIKNHKVYMTAGHDEYWSGPHRANVEAALAAGVNMAFFSGNEVFWKTRWENSIDGTNTPYRTLVCYKETLVGTNSGGIMDPDDPPTWTGTWRDPRFSPPSDGGKPENALTGNIFMVNGPGDDNPGNLAMSVPQADGQMRFWRNTSIASQSPGATHTLPAGTLGYEWDEDLDNGARPAGAFQLSTTTYTLTTDFLLDFGATYGAGTATHHAMMYRAPSGALVFGAGTIQWTWGLDANHDNPFTNVLPSNPPADVNMQQATLNLLADMGVQPATIQSGLVAATKSTDTTAPTSTITSPSGATTVAAGTPITISGTAVDSGGGHVGGVEVSVNGGQSWHPATGRSNWTYTWIPSVTGSTSIKSRAVDDSGNLESPGPGDAVTVNQQVCPCDAWSPSNPTAVPATADSGDGTSVNVGVKFYTDVTGYATGIRFYKSAANTGTHIGNLWSSSGTLLASATFTNETSSGWQQVSFSSPVLVSAGTTYVASYLAPVGHYSADPWYFYSNGIDDPPVHLVGNSVSPNGVFTYSSSPAFPTSSVNSTNYWVDVVFSPSTVQLSPGSLTFANQLIGTSSTPQAVTMNNTGNTSLSISSITITGTNSTDFTQTNNCGTTLGPNGTCTINVTFTPTGVSTRGATLTITDNATVSTQIVSLTGTGTETQEPPGTCPCSLWDMAATPVTIDSNDANGIELGVKFNANQNGFVTGIMFYKAPTNTGTHIGNLWTTTGVNLGTVIFTNEGTSGWQQMNFANPIAITANTTYIASYYTSAGHYSVNPGFFGTALSAPPLTGLADNGSGNGVYAYGSASAFPGSSYNSSNYWVDLIFVPSPFSASPTSLAFGNQTVASASTSQPVTLSNSGSTAFNITGITFTGTNPGDFSQTNTCNGSIAGGATCTVNVVFTPAGVGSRSATLTITTNATGGTQTISLSGTGVAPTAALSATSLTFQSVLVGATSAAQTVILSNNGNAALTLSSVSIIGTNNTDFAQFNNCGTTLAVGANCTISLNFTPTASGARTATLSIADNAPGTPQTVVLNGTGLTTAPGDALCPCTLWAPSATPATLDSGDGNGIEVGVKFTADESGYITGIRFYKGIGNTGTHIGNLWTTTGTNLATGTFTSETASGWQQLNFSTPVAITANTTYIASYYAPIGHYSVDSFAFTDAGLDNPPLHAISNTVSADGVFTYGAASAFPSSTSTADNYWVDVVFTPNTVSLTSATIVFPSQVLGTTSSSQIITLFNQTASSASISSIAITGGNNGDFGQTNNCGSSLASGASCNITLTFTPTASGTRTSTLTVTDNAANSPQTAVLTGTGAALPACPCSIWNTSVTPASPDSGDGNAVELGVKFTVNQPGLITGILFYKSAANTGTHIGNLWTLSGTLLATGTFTNETASGWQQLTFTTPVQVSANTTYVASYHAPVGHYSGDASYFATTGVSNPPLQALANTVSADGVYAYGATSAFPTSTYNATNYWVDVVFVGGSGAYSISGGISGNGGNVATVTLSNGSTTVATTTSSSTGAYSFTGIGNGNYTVTPTKSGFGFSPVSQAVTVNSANVTVPTFSSAASTYSVSGSITGTGGNTASVTLTSGTTTVATTTASSTGSYTFTGIANGGYTITPTKSGFSFSPVNQAVTVNNANVTVPTFSSTASTFTVSGSITGTGGNAATVTLTSGSTTVATTTASATGAYTFTGIANGSYTVTPTKTGFAFTPASQAVTVNSANVTVPAFSSAAAYTVSGSITGTGGNAATVTLTSGSTTIATTTASSTGAYSFAAIVNGSYTVTPTKTGFAFTPANRAITVSNANLTVPSFSSAAASTISGTITGNGGNGATVTLTSGGTTIATTTASTAGAYSFPGVANGTYTVTPTKSGFTLLPASQSVTVNGANVSNINFATSIAIDATVSHDGTTNATTIVSGAFSTTAANELVLAFVSAGWRSGSNTTVSSVTGGGLTWTLVLRTNTQRGTAEIWRAFATGTITNATVTAGLSQSVTASITVVTFKNVSTSGTNGSGAIGATASANATFGAPSASLTTTKTDSLVIGVGTDITAATSRTIGSGQTMVHQDVATTSADTYWVQRQTNSTAVSGTRVTINDTAPTFDGYSLTICEILTQ